MFIINLGGGSIMFWGGFGFRGKLKLIKTSNRLNSIEYTNILEESLVIDAPNITINGYLGYILQQDNASIHTSSHTKRYLSRIENLRILDWPARSPDLNPIENLWGILAYRVYGQGKQYSTIEELERAVYSAWDSIELEILENLINSMPNRMGSVIFNHGKITEY